MLGVRSAPRGGANTDGEGNISLFSGEDRWRAWLEFRGAELDWRIRGELEPIYVIYSARGENVSRLKLGGGETGR
jgi:hypothetical protein